MGHTYGRRRALLKRMQRGFTMVEVIVAIGMLTLVGLAAAQFAVTAVHSSYAHQQRAITVGLAESGMERVQESVKGKEGNTIFSTLTSGMSKSGAQEALKAAIDFNVIENASDTMDLGWNDSPSATAIQAKVETNDQQGRHHVYRICGCRQMLSPVCRGFLPVRVEARSGDFIRRCRCVQICRRRQQSR